jgi:hypothetical protein
MKRTASIRRDAVSRNGAFQFEEKVLSRRIVLIDRKGAIVMVTGMIYSYLFAEESMREGSYPSQITTD